MKRLVVLTCAVVLLPVMALALVPKKNAQKQAQRMNPGADALNLITKDGLMNHIKVLSSDEFEGRGPGTRGEDLSINYIADQFKKIGLAPGNTDGTYFQKVPLVGITTSQDAAMSVKVGGKDLRMKFGDDFVARTVRVVDKTSFDADMVFVGYGVVAPEYGWDDYKGQDVRGKVLLMIVNDPQVPDPRDPSKLDDKMFKGRAMTYYGRWTYKFEIAAEKGA